MSDEMQTTGGGAVASQSAGGSELENNEQKSSAMSFLSSAEVIRQLILVLALVVVVGIGIVIIYWASEPDMRPLGEMETEELILTLDFLDKERIPYKVERNIISVESDIYQDVRLRVQREGIAVSRPAGDDILLQDMGFGVSQRMEKERLKLSRERKLSEAIEQFQNVSRAQVLLAIPKENVFTRREKKPSATVMLTLTRASGLKQEETDAIVDMVASAVQGLDPTRVTVTDQHGRLLNSGSMNPMASKNRKEYEQERRREEEYKNKINTILIPVLGLNNFTSEVDVSLDFTSVEQTQKRYNPDLPAVRSEMTVEDNSVGSSLGGIPGALSNQPPLESDIPEEAVGKNAKKKSSSGRSHKESTRNYELDTTISHTRQQVGGIRRLSVSVAVDYLAKLDKDGKTTMQPRDPQSLATIRRLLQGGIGFDITRGDTLEVVNLPFVRPDLDVMPELPIWENPVYMYYAKLLAVALVLIVIIMVLVRPMVNRLITGEAQDDEKEDLSSAVAAYEGDEDMELLSATNSDIEFGIREGQLSLPDLHKDEDLLKAVRALVANEPDLAAMVIKDWVVNKDE